MPAEARFWCVYILVCRGGGQYTGITPDPERRYAQHLRGKGAFYTRLNPPEALVGYVWFANRKDAAIAERRVKRMSASERLAWILACGAKPVTSPATLAVGSGNPGRQVP